MSKEKFEVVISGVGGMYPECSSFDEFRELLFSGKSGVTVNDKRWNIGKRVYFLKLIFVDIRSLNSYFFFFFFKRRNFAHQIQIQADSSGDM